MSENKKLDDEVATIKVYLSDDLDVYASIEAYCQKCKMVIEGLTDFYRQVTLKYFVEDLINFTREAYVCPMCKTSPVIHEIKTVYEGFDAIGDKIKNYAKCKNENE